MTGSGDEGGAAMTAEVAAGKSSRSDSVRNSVEEIKLHGKSVSKICGHSRELLLLTQVL